MRNKHGLVVELRIGGSIDSGSEAVRSLLYRASREILFNIVKHSGVRRAELQLRRAGNELQLNISDKGRGFDPALLAEAEGAGLLSIRERVQFLGGRMNVTSSPGRGSMFQIMLPDALVPAQGEVLSPTSLSSE
jgi:signal transduction histidine kinase